RLWGGIGVVGGRRRPLLGVPVRAIQGRSLLALPWGLRLGDWRSLPAVRGEVPGDRPRYTTLEYKPALGTGVGRTRLRRAVRHRPDPQTDGAGWLGHHDLRRARDLHRRCRR